jgi:hypothetical protein
LGSFGSLTVAGANILHGGSDAAVPECLPDEGQIDVASHQMRRERMLQAMGMALLGRKPSGLRVGLKHPKKLAPVKPATLLAGKQEIRTVSRALAQPSPQGSNLVQKGLPAMRINRLNRRETPFEPSNDNATLFQINISEPDPARHH